MGTMREVDCFVTVTTMIITDIEKTLIDFRLDDVGDVGIIETVLMYLVRFSNAII